MGYILLTLMVDELAIVFYPFIQKNVVVLFDYHWMFIELQNSTFGQTCLLEQLELGTTSNIANNNSKLPFIWWPESPFDDSFDVPNPLQSESFAAMKKNAGCAVVIFDGDESAIGNIGRVVGVVVGHLVAP
jgi:hypothetical protein